MKANNVNVFNYVKAHDGVNITVADIAEALELSKRTVSGIVTMSFQRHKNADGEVEPLMERVPAEIELEDGSHEQVKFIRLTDAGRAFTPVLDAEDDAE